MLQGSASSLSFQKLLQEGSPPQLPHDQCGDGYVIHSVSHSPPNPMNPRGRPGTVPTGNSAPASPEVGEGLARKSTRLAQMGTPTWRRQPAGSQHHLRHTGMPAVLASIPRGLTSISQDVSCPVRGPKTPPTSYPRQNAGSLLSRGASRLHGLSGQLWVKAQENGLHCILALTTALSEMSLIIGTRVSCPESKHMQASDHARAHIG